MNRPVIRLVLSADNALQFPFGGVNAAFDRDANVPSTLMYQYPAGDFDSFAFPLSDNLYMTDVERKLARALFDEREMNDFFPSNAVIELPDGSVFDFDFILAGA